MESQNDIHPVHLNGAKTNGGLRNAIKQQVFEANKHA